MKKEKRYAVLTKVTEGNRVDEKVLFEQVMFNLDETDKKRYESFGEICVEMKKTEEATIKEIEKITEKKIVWKKNFFNYYGYSPVSDTEDEAIAKIDAIIKG